ncbi:MAG: cyclic nucleotide-binding domain-containing protein [Desulfobacterales bacterium]
MDERIKKQALVDAYISKGDIKSAVELLFDLIVGYAQKKEFIQAEQLREKLIEVDSMALSEIIKSGERIEEEKAKSIDKQHLAVWADLYGMLTAEEANAVYFSLTETTLDPGQILFEQGKKNGSLFLVEEGSLMLICSFRGKSVMVRRVEKGGFAGDDTFFQLSAFSSVSAVTESPVQLRCLKKMDLKVQNEKFPGLRSKIHDYCIKAGLTDDAVRVMKLDRRSERRFDIQNSGVFQLLDRSGQAMGSPWKGTLSDLSPGGISFFMRISKKETAALLPGRKLMATFALPTEKGLLKIKKSGIITNVTEDAFNDYSLHVRFDNVLHDEIVTLIQRHFGSGRNAETSD